MELRLLPQPRPIGYEFPRPLKSLGAALGVPALAVLESPALRAICPVGGCDRWQCSSTRDTERR